MLDWERLGLATSGPLTRCKIMKAEVGTKATCKVNVGARMTNMTCPCRLKGSVEIIQESHHD